MDERFSGRSSGSRRIRSTMNELPSFGSSIGSWHWEQGLGAVGDNIGSCGMPHELGNVSNSDVVVKLIVDNQEEKLVYSHTEVLSENSEYFATYLSARRSIDELGPNSRMCIEVSCTESDIDFHVWVLALFYVSDEVFFKDWHNIENALGIFKVASKLKCNHVVSKCLLYLEASPWARPWEDFNHEADILTALSTFRPALYKPVVARIEPVDTAVIRNVFMAAIRAGILVSSEYFELKTTAQAQVEYMLEVNGDAALLEAGDLDIIEIKRCFSHVLLDFKSAVIFLLQNVNSILIVEEIAFFVKLHDLLWVSRVLQKIRRMDDVISLWVESSEPLMNLLNEDRLKDVFWNSKLKIVQIVSVILQVVGDGSVISKVEESEIISHSVAAIH